MKRNLFFIVVALLSTQFFSCSFVLDEMFDYTDKDYSKYTNSSSTKTYGAYSDVPSDAIELTVDAMSGSSRLYNSRYISSSYQYFYFQASSGTTYYITWYDENYGSNKLSDFGYSDYASIRVGGSFSGAQDDISEYVKGYVSSSSYGYTYKEMKSSGYYVLKIKPLSSGYYAIRVSTSLP